MLGFKCIFVEKKDGFNVEAKSLMEDFKSNLRIESLQGVRVVNKYILGELKEDYYQKALFTIFAEKTVDNLYEENLPVSEDEIAFAVEFLPGQYDQRADATEQCFQLLTGEKKVKVKCAKIYVVNEEVSEEDILKIQKYLINPVDQRLASLELPKNLDDVETVINQVPVVEGFINF